MCCFFITIEGNNTYRIKRNYSKVSALFNGFLNKLCLLLFKGFTQNSIWFFNLTKIKTDL